MKMTLHEEPTLISTFFIGATLMGVNAMDVQEVVQLSTLTPVYGAEDYIAGIINLRGQIVTVVDLRRRLEIEIQEDRIAHDIFIVASMGENIGLLVDAAADVIPADLDNLDPLPANMSMIQQKFLQGICQNEARPIAILNVNAILATEQDETSNPSSR
jgi:purine-binding chemotaxis protein CheW